MDLFDIAYKAVTGIGLLGILAGVWHIANRVGGIEQWIRTTDREVQSQAALLQQQESKLSELAGWMRGKHDDP